MPIGVILLGMGKNWLFLLSTTEPTFIRYKAKNPIEVFPTTKKIKNPSGPINPINKEHTNGPAIAPNAKANCKPAPAATNLSLEIKSLVWDRFKENKGKLQNA